MRPALRAYLATVIATGALSLAVAVARPVAAVETAAVMTAAVLLSLAFAAQLRPVHLSHKTKITVEDAATFAGALLLPIPLAMLVGGGSTGMAQLFRRGASWYSRAFNASVATLDTGAAASTYLLLGGPEGDVEQQIGALIAAGIVKLAVNTLLVDVAVGLQMRRSPLAAWQLRHGPEMPHLAALYLLGAIGAFAAQRSQLALVVVVAPSLLVILSLRAAARLRVGTRRAVRAMASLIEQRDAYTYGHSQRVAEYAERLARRLRLEPVQVELVRDAALLHDVGKVRTADRVLQKPGALDDAEREEMHRHAEFGYELLASLPEFWEGAEFVRSHHERVDGTGYPRGLRGSEVPIEVSIIAVADTYDAMTTDRVYRRALPWPVVRSELERERGRQWHAPVVDAFVAMIEQERAAALSAEARTA